MDCCVETPPATVAINEDLLPDQVNAPQPRDDPNRKCFNCRGASRAVTRKTMLLMLKSKHFDRIDNSDYRFCLDQDCPVVYFSENGGSIFRTTDLRIRVGLKERVDPIPLCYCFGFDEKDVRDEIAETGSSTIAERITTLIKAGMCSCPARNPSGACCLGEVNQTIKRLTSG
jgi:CopZ-like zinc binding protein